MSIAELPGLGATTARQLAQVGITDEQALLASDPFEIYSRLKQRKPSTSINFLYALIGAQENKHWQQVRQEQRLSILLRLDDMGLAPR